MKEIEKVFLTIIAVTLFGIIYIVHKLLSDKLITWVLSIIVGVFFAVYLVRSMTKEGFELWKEIPRTPFLELTTPTGYPDQSGLSPGGSSAPYLPLPLAPMGTELARSRFGDITSPICYSQDQSEPLRPVRNYLQRTNNYLRTHPDSCSAPNHELVGTFYLPTDTIQPGAASGLPYPASTQCA